MRSSSGFLTSIERVFDLRADAAGGEMAAGHGRRGHARAAQRRRAERRIEVRLEELDQQARDVGVRRQRLLDAAAR